MKNYVLDHDFGYGTCSKKIKKLKLRNVDDLKDYVKDLIDTQFFSNNALSSQLVIEII